MKRSWIRTLVLGVFLAGTPAVAGPLPQAAILLKELGDSYLSARQYGEAVDSYIGALEYVPWYPKVHYNLGAVYLKGFRNYEIAAYHFEMYLTQTQNAKDRGRVSALVETLKSKASEKAPQREATHTAVGRRLLLRRPDNLKSGQEVEVSMEGAEESVSLRVVLSYPGWVLTEPVPEGSVAEPFLAQSNARTSNR